MEWFKDKISTEIKMQKVKNFLEKCTWRHIQPSPLVIFSLLWFFIISPLIVVDDFSRSLLCVFTFLFYKHLLLFFLPRETKFFPSISASLLFLQCRFCLLLALQKKLFLVYYLRLCLNICVCVNVFSRYCGGAPCVQYARRDDETLFIIRSRASLHL